MSELGAGLARIERLLERHGFGRTAQEAGKGSGGPFESATFGRGDRELRLWLRGDSLSVAYRVGEAELDHAAYMRELLGPAGANRFPAYADDAERALAALEHDLGRFCGDFLAGDGGEFRRCAAASREEASLTGAQRLTRVEERLRRGS